MPVRWPGLLTIVLAVGAGVAPLPPEHVERWFSTWFYPAVQRVVTPVSNAVPFALFDGIVLAAAAGVIVLLARAGRAARRTRRWSPIGRAGWTLAVAAAALYVLFLGMWGLNYRRVAMRDRVLVEAGQPSVEEVIALGREAVARMNALHAAAHATGWTGNDWRDARFTAAFADVLGGLTDAPPAIPGRAKATVLGAYFRWSGVDGMVDPFALEVLVNPDLLAWERPFVQAHEWAHLAGFADESDANFVGWLTCLRSPDPAAQYSGWLYLFWQVSGEVDPAARASLVDGLATGPRRDVDAIADRLRRGEFPLLRTVSWMMYDQYLRANRVEGGVRSYGAVVTLILRARFDEARRPVLRAAQTPTAEP